MNLNVFEILILGSNSAVPMKGRYPSAQLVNIHEKLFLMDCGEGTQNRLAEHNIKRSRISHIFISHLHGDHVLGLPGLLNSFSLAGRLDEIHIYGPVGLDKYLNDCLENTYSHIQYDLHFHILDHNLSSICYQDDSCSVIHFPLIHRVPTIGYKFEENRLKRDLDQITGSQKFRSYCYCSDNYVTEALLPYIKDVTVLYHETTYLHELKDKAEATKHSTARDVAKMAKHANVGQLVTGHYSSRYDNIEVFYEECRNFFDSVILGQEGTKIDLSYST